MKSRTTDKIFGAIILTIVVGIHLGFILGPVAFGAFLAAVIVGLARQKQALPINKNKKARVDELITTVLPIIDPKN